MSKTSPKSKGVRAKQLLTYSQRQQVIARAKAGEDDRTLAKEFALTQRRVQQLRATPLTAPYRRVITRDEQRQVLAMVKQGLSHKEIGEALGIAYGSVSHVIERAKRPGRGA